MQILNERQEALVRDERKTLNDLRLALVQFGGVSEESDTLGKSIDQLEELFLLVVVGEFNAGKSAFINALLGEKLLQEGVTPTTTQIEVLRYGPTQSRDVKSQHHHTLTVPADMLRSISIVDTPGTNAIIREHERITAQFIPRADLVLFITSADRPFTESERQFLVQIKDWGKKIVLVINKIDILQSAQDRDAICKYVSDNTSRILGIAPDVFAISARQAFQAKQGQNQLWDASGFESLETYIHNRLDEKGRLRLKLLSPLGTGTHLANKYLEVITNRLLLLEKDFQMLADVDAQLKVFDEDLKRDFRYRLSDVEQPLYQLEKRGDAFFDETLRIARIVDLIAKDRIQHEFEHQVVADVPQQIERKVNEVIDWIIESQLHQWQSVTQHIADRRREHQDRIVGDAGIGSFDYDRDRLMAAVGRDARKVIDTFDKNYESKLIAEDAQAMVTTSLAVEAGAIGLGALVTVLATTAAADVTGIVSASVIAALGLFIIPTRRRAAKKDLSGKIATLREHLIQSLTAAFDNELARSQQKIREAIGPYVRFVRAESGKLQDAQAQFESIKNEIDRLKVLIDQLDAQVAEKG